MEEKYIKVRVTTNAKRESVRLLSEDTFAIAVKEKPEQNRANKRIIQLVASHLDTSVKKVHLIKGHHSPSKTFLVDSA